MNLVSKQLKPVQVKELEKAFKDYEELKESGKIDMNPRLTRAEKLGGSAKADEKDQSDLTDAMDADSKRT